MNSQEISNSLINNSSTDILVYFGLVPVVKISIIIIQFTYVVYSFILTRQIKLLNQSFCTPFKKFFRLISYLHFFASVLIFILTTIIFLTKAQP